MFAKSTVAKSADDKYVTQALSLQSVSDEYRKAGSVCSAPSNSRIPHAGGGTPPLQSVTTVNQNTFALSSDRGALEIAGVSLLYEGSRVKSYLLGRDLNPMGRGNGSLYAQGMFSAGNTRPKPSATPVGGFGNSINNGCGDDELPCPPMGRVVRKEDAISNNNTVYSSSEPPVVDEMGCWSESGLVHCSRKVGCGESGAAECDKWLKTGNDSYKNKGCLISVVCRTDGDGCVTIIFGFDCDNENCTNTSVPKGPCHGGDCSDLSGAIDRSITIKEDPEGIPEEPDCLVLCHQQYVQDQADCWIENIGNVGSIVFCLWLAYIRYVGCCADCDE